MENTTSRLAICIRNFPPYEVNWDDRSPQKSRHDLTERDILPSDEDSEYLYDHMLKFMMSFIVKELKCLSDLAQFIPSAVQQSCQKSEVVPLKLLFRDEKSIDENIQILVQYAKDAALNGSPQVYLSLINLGCLQKYSVLCTMFSVLRSVCCVHYTTVLLFSVLSTGIHCTVHSNYIHILLVLVTVLI